MPHVDSELQDFAGILCFGVLDFVSGYWQLPLDPESHGKCGVATPKGTYSSKRTLPDLTNATAHFQSTVEPLFQDLLDTIKAWIDDFIIHTKSEEQLLQALERFLQISQKHGLYLPARKEPILPNLYQVVRPNCLC